MDMSDSQPRERSFIREWGAFVVVLLFAVLGAALYYRDVVRKRAGGDGEVMVQARQFRVEGPGGEPLTINFPGFPARELSFPTKVCPFATYYGEADTGRTVLGIFLHPIFHQFFRDQGLSRVTITFDDLQPPLSVRLNVAAGEQSTFLPYPPGIEPGEVRASRVVVAGHHPKRPNFVIFRGGPSRGLGSSSAE